MGPLAFPSFHLVAIQRTCCAAGGMSQLSIYQLQGKWSHSQGGEIEVQPDPDGSKVIITHPTVGKQTLELNKFLTADGGIDYFGFKGKMEGTTKVIWNNGVNWTKNA